MRLTHQIRNFWYYLRQVSGDDAYERYLAHRQLAHGSELPLSRQQFFKKRQEEKWGKVSRCC